MSHKAPAILSLVCLLSASAFAQSGNLGPFTNSGDVGDPAIKGSTEFSNGQYRITGSGANIWAKQDQFQYVWREMSGNFTVTATMRFLGQGADHRKAGIMIRQSLDTDAAYADVVIHGTGMPGLQWRSKQGEDTNAFDLPIEGPGTFTIKLVRIGVKIYMYMSKDGSEPKKIANTEVGFRGAILVGLVVCSHQADASTTVVFSNVSVEAQPTAIARTGAAQTFHPEIPRAWDDKKVEHLEVPLAQRDRSPRYMNAEEYYALKVRPIYRAYPRYVPGREPVPETEGARDHFRPF